MIYADFESNLMPQDNGKRNPSECYKNKHKKYAAWSYGYKLVCVDLRSSQPFKSYLDEDAANKFYNSMIEERKYCSDVIKNFLKI